MHGEVGEEYERHPLVSVNFADWWAVASFFQKMVTTLVTLGGLIVTVVSATITVTLLLGKYSSLPADYDKLANGQAALFERVDSVERWEHLHNLHVTGPVEDRLSRLEASDARHDTTTARLLEVQRMDHRTIVRMDCLLKALAKVSGRSPFQCSGVGVKADPPDDPPE